MPLTSRKQGRIYIPPCSSNWSFNEAASPIIDKGGLANLTGTGGTFNGESVQFGGASSYFQSPAGAYDKLATFSCFILFKPNASTADSDVLAIGSGSGGTANDYTWYLDTNSASTGFYFGVAPGSGNYGAQLDVPMGSIDTTKKHAAFFGYLPGAAGNNAFLFLQREGDPVIYSGFSNAMSAFQTGRGHYLTNSADAAGGTISVNYFRMLFWNNQYLQNPALFKQLVSMYGN